MLQFGVSEHEGVGGLEEGMFSVRVRCYVWVRMNSGLWFC